MANKFSKHYSSTSQGVYQLKKGITEEEIIEIANDTELDTLVIEKILKKQEYENLEKYIFSTKKGVLLSIFRMFYEEEVLSMKFLLYLPSVKELKITGMASFSDFEDTSLMTGIEDFAIGRCDLEFFEILKIMPPNLKKLSLGELNSKKLNIDFISRFEKLEKLSVQGHSKGIEAVGKLENLQDLTLRSISHPSLDFIKNLHQLWSLDIKLGGIKDFSILPQMPNIKYLELWYIKGLNEISFISEMTQLQSLHLESLANITALPSFDKLPKFRRIRLMNMTNLLNFETLKTAPILNDFFFTIINKQQPEDLLPVLQNPTLKNVYVYFPSDKKNNLFKELANKEGIESVDYWPTFEFE
jgi:hypothetical protein